MARMHDVWRHLGSAVGGRDGSGVGSAVGSGVGAGLGAVVGKDVGSVVGVRLAQGFVVRMVGGTRSLYEVRDALARHSVLCGSCRFSLGSLLSSRFSLLASFFSLLLPRNSQLAACNCNLSAHTCASRVVRPTASGSSLARVVPARRRGPVVAYVSGARQRKARALGADARGNGLPLVVEGGFGQGWRVA